MIQGFDYALAADVMAAWTVEDSQAALREGWDLFINDSSANGPVQIQYLVEPCLLPELGYDEPRFETDEMAWEHVYFSAKAGSALHHKAMTLVEQANPMEAEAIEAHIKTLGT